MTFRENIEKINILKDEWDKLQPISRENHENIWKKFRLEWNFNSNHIEGNTLTYGETELLLMFDKTTGDHELREYEEMQAHDVAIKMIKEWANHKERDITEADIRSLNKLILVKPFWKEAITFDGQPTRRLIKIGEYKEFPNSVRLRNGENFNYAKPEETPHLMEELISWYKKNKNEYPIILASEMHYRFILIHPFDDGNGRVARLIVNYILMKNDYPPIIIKSNEKENYLTALQKADVGDKESFHNYMAEQLILSLELIIKAAKGESIEEEEDFDKKLKLLKQEVEAEDKEKEIKTRLTVGVVKNAFEKWVIKLFTEMAKTTYKFNDFYDRPLHYISVILGSSGPSTHFEKEPDFKKIIQGFNPDELDKPLNSASIKFQCSFGAYKKGGINPFVCNYSLEIKFNEYNYEIWVGFFNPDNAGYLTKSCAKKILHKPLSNDEIKQINKSWGENLLQHLTYNRKQLNKNENN